MININLKIDYKKEKKTTQKNRQSKQKNRTVQRSKNPKNERVIFAFLLPSSKKKIALY
jgi:DNA-binding MarR family transcriptional regulator